MGEAERIESALDYEDILERLDFANHCLSIPKNDIQSRRINRCLLRFLTNFRKLSTKNATKLEFFKIVTVFRKKKMQRLICTIIGKNYNF